jgi:hypothetical protein
MKFTIKKILKFLFVIFLIALIYIMLFANRNIIEGNVNSKSCNSLNGEINYDKCKTTPGCKNLVKRKHGISTYWCTGTKI